MKNQACQDNGNYVQTNLINPGMTPFPSAADPDTFLLPPRRRASETSLKILVSTTGQHCLKRGGETNAPLAPMEISPGAVITKDQGQPLVFV